MSKHNFGYFIHEGVSNMFSHGFMSFAAIGITVACLLIMGTFTLVAVNANGLLKDLERENEMLAFVEEDFQEPQSLQLKVADPQCGLRHLHQPPAGHGELPGELSRGGDVPGFGPQYSAGPLFH